MTYLIAQNNEFNARAKIAAVAILPLIGMAVALLQVPNAIDATTTICPGGDYTIIDGEASNGSNCHF
jgi:hypothetical protein